MIWTANSPDGSPFTKCLNILKVVSPIDKGIDAAVEHCSEQHPIRNSDGHLYQIDYTKSFNKVPKEVSLTQQSWSIAEQGLI